jgi:hypothetical protein
VTDQERKWVLAVATRGDLEVSKPRVLGETTPSSLHLISSFPTPAPDGLLRQRICIKLLFPLPPAFFPDPTLTVRRLINRHSSNAADEGPVCLQATTARVRKKR